MSDGGDGAIDDAEFAALMARAGPFEAAPHIAVAVSGGPDSMALALLAANWLGPRAARLSALTVDHGLRSASGAEARQVGEWLRARSIEHTVLRWREPKPRTGIQAAARDARLRLLLNWCSRAGVLHLLYAHQQEDQAVTMLQRLAHGSGPDGLSGMPLVHIRPHGSVSGVRLIRPLLDMPRRRLIATLEKANQAWIEDPSNSAPRFARARLERSFAQLAEEGLSVGRLARLAGRAGEDRAAFDQLVAAWLARHASPHPAGFVLVDRRALRQAPLAVARRVLSRLISSVSGAAYPPRGARVNALIEALHPEKFPGRTLGGCRIAQRAERLLICREPAAIREELTLRAGEEALWDGRFFARITADVRNDTCFTLRRLGKPGIAEARAMAGDAHIFDALPAPVRPALPAFFDLDGLVALPHIELTRKDKCGTFRNLAFTAALRPVVSLAPTEFVALTNRMKSDA